METRIGSPCHDRNVVSADESGDEYLTKCVWLSVAKLMKVLTGM